MSAHTPGPWTAGLTESRKVQACVIGAKNEAGFTPWVCHIQTCDVDTGNANARLIAAAPDLLQELRNIANADTAEWDDRTEFEAWAKSRARAAIAKATGVDQ